MVTDALAHSPASLSDNAATYGRRVAPAILPDGHRVYAVGDVHGLSDRLAALHAMIASHLAAYPVAAPVLVHLGDYVDRGPDSAGVLARLRSSPVGGLPTVNLMGNHEAMMLLALTPGRYEAPLHWLENGGDKALQSWGLSITASAKEWRRSLPGGVEAFLKALPVSHQVGPYFFVHAGLRPGVALESQSREDMLWIRSQFLNHEGDLAIPGATGLVVVHGHTPMPEPVVRPNRISIDTGAVMGGPLTCAVLEGDRVEFLAA